MEGTLYDVMKTPRHDFLIAEYNQLMNDINRHILVIWQSLTALVGSFTIYALVEKNVISIDIAASLGVLIAVWTLCHIFDASYWYNRNLVMIANIERQFLVTSDLKDIHYYFGKHRPKNRMITHLKIQIGLALGVVIVVICFHFSERVYPGFSAPLANFEFMRLLPYLLLGLGTWFILWIHSQRREDYEEFLRNSPGKAIDTAGIDYGAGHAHKPGDEQVQEEQSPTRPKAR